MRDAVVALARRLSASLSRWCQEIDDAHLTAVCVAAGWGADRIVTVLQR